MQITYNMLSPGRERGRGLEASRPGLLTLWYHPGRMSPAGMSYLVMVISRGSSTPVAEMVRVRVFLS